MDTPLLNMNTFCDPSVSILSGFECIDNMNYTAIYWVSCFTNSQKVLSFHQVKLCNCTLNSINTASVTLDYTRPTLNSLRL